VVSVASASVVLQNRNFYLGVGAGVVAAKSSDRDQSIVAAPGCAVLARTLPQSSDSTARTCLCIRVRTALTVGILEMYIFLPAVAAGDGSVVVVSPSYAFFPTAVRSSFFSLRRE
jgi:hypothetical protein